MEELESQIAKIQLGNERSASSFVFVLAEKAAISSAELYMVAELPLLNPAAEESCERICLAAASALKRAYRYPASADSFENAIGQINEELGKLAGMGQTQWIDKLSCVLGVKEGQVFRIATCGKVSAFLLRAGEFTDISCSSDQPHPLKTFENYASGKLKLGDLLILSTAQLFNYLSLDRLLQILSETDFLAAARMIIELLKQTADPQIAFGVLMNLQVAPGQAPEAETDLENYVVESPAAGQSRWTKALAFLKTVFSGGAALARQPQTALPKIGLKQSLKNWSGSARNFAQKSRSWWQGAKTSARTVTAAAKPSNFKQLSTTKKFFLVSVAVLIVAAVLNIIIADHLKNSKAAAAQMSGQLQSAQALLSNAEASLLYKDSTSAAVYLAQAQAKLPGAKSVPAGDKSLYSQLASQAQSLQSQLQKAVSAPVSNLGSLAKGANLIVLPQFLAAQAGQDIVSYNRQTGSVVDGNLKIGVAIKASVDVSATAAVVYDGTALYVWDFSTGSLGPAFTENVPPQADFGGLAYYPTNSRVYMVDKQAGDVVSFLVNKNSLSRPVVALRGQDFSQASGLAIDGSIYVLNGGAVSKFLAGSPASFSLAATPATAGAGAKIFTQKTFTNFYTFDPANSRILVTDKTGALIETLKSDQFRQATDFTVDEPNKLIYVLSDGSLLKVSLP